MSSPYRFHGIGCTVQGFAVIWLILDILVVENYILCGEYPTLGGVGGFVLGGGAYLTGTL